jgi:hypothetical protein
VGRGGAFKIKFSFISSSIAMYSPLASAPPRGGEVSILIDCLPGGHVMIINFGVFSLFGEKLAIFFKKTKLFMAIFYA